MTLLKLSKRLNEMYNSAPKGDGVAMIHLFGIKYAEEIKNGKFSKKEIAVKAGIHESYGTEISKGVKLAQYVIMKNS